MIEQASCCGLSMVYFYCGILDFLDKDPDSGSSFDLILFSSRLEYCAIYCYSYHLLHALSIVCLEKKF